MDFSSMMNMFQTGAPMQSHGAIDPIAMGSVMASNPDAAAAGLASQGVSPGMIPFAQGVNPDTVSGAAPPDAAGGGFGFKMPGAGELQKGLAGVKAPAAPAGVPLVTPPSPGLPAIREPQVQQPRAIQPDARQVQQIIAQLQGGGQQAPGLGALLARR